MWASRDTAQLSFATWSGSKGVMVLVFRLFLQTGHSHCKKQLIHYATFIRLSPGFRARNGYALILVLGHPDPEPGCS